MLKTGGLACARGGGGGTMAGWLSRGKGLEEEVQWEHLDS